MELRCEDNGHRFLLLIRNHGGVSRMEYQLLDDKVSPFSEGSRWQCLSQSKGLKMQRRWVLWRLEPGKDGKQTKVPYRVDGRKTSITNPSHLHTFAELEPYAAKFSGIGLALGEFDGVSVWGVDFDKCCDAVTGKFSPETRQVVIDLDCYGEYSPSGTGCHVLGIGKLPTQPGNKAEVLVRPYPGCKQIEVKGRGFYFTFTGRHLSKTPPGLEDRQ